MYELVLAQMFDVFASSTVVIHAALEQDENLNLASSCLRWEQFICIKNFQTPASK